MNVFTVTGTVLAVLAYYDAGPGMGWAIAWFAAGIIVRALFVKATFS